MADPLPARLDIDDLRAAYRKAEMLLVPASAKTVSVLLDRLWATLPMPKTKTGQPDKAAIAEWKRHLSPYPEDLLSRAVDSVVLTHKWETQPKVAQVIEHLRDDMAERTAWRNKLRNAGMKAKTAPPAKPASGKLIRDMEPDERETFFADLRRKYPQGFAAVRSAQTAKA
jgi:hypothetical protein